MGCAWQPNIPKTSRPVKWKEQIRGIFYTSLLSCFDILLKQQKLYLPSGLRISMKCCFVISITPGFEGYTTCQCLPGYTNVSYIPVWTYEHGPTVFFGFYPFLNNNCTHFSNLFEIKVYTTFHRKKLLENTSRIHYMLNNYFSLKNVNFTAINVEYFRLFSLGPDFGEWPHHCLC